MKDAKGSLYALESAIAVMMMVTALALLLRTPMEPEELTEYNYKYGIYNALELAEALGTLRTYAHNNDANGVKTEIAPYISSSIQFEVTIFDRNSNTTAIPDMSSNLGSVVSVSYFIAGKAGSSNPKEIRVYAWGFD